MEHTERDMKEEMWIVGCRYSWRKTEVAAQDRTDKWLMAYDTLGVQKLTKYSSLCDCLVMTDASQFWTMCLELMMVDP